MSREEKANGKTSIDVKSEEEENYSDKRKFCMVEHSKGTCECMKLVPSSMISDKEPSGEVSKEDKISGKSLCQPKQVNPGIHSLPNHLSPERHR